MIAAACGTVTASAIKGTASEPKPAPKPLLLMPMSSTAEQRQHKKTGR